jgi:hypothetical protein
MNTGKRLNIAEHEVSHFTFMPCGHNGNFALKVGVWSSMYLP